MPFRYRDTKTGKLVSESTWKRSRAKGGKRYKRERSPSRRKSSAKKKSEKKVWRLRYKIPAKKGRNGWKEFNGELIFSTSSSVTEKQARKIAKRMFQGEKPKGTEFQSFTHGRNGDYFDRRTDDFDDLLDYDFVYYGDDEDSYVESASS